MSAPLGKRRLSWALAAGLCLSGIVGAPASAEEKKPVYIEYQTRSDGGIDVWALNALEGDATVDLDLDLAGLRPTTYKRTAVVPKRGVVLLARLSRTGGGYSWHYSYYYQYGKPG